MILIFSIVLVIAVRAVMCFGALHVLGVCLIFPSFLSRKGLLFWFRLAGEISEKAGGSWFEGCGIGCCLPLAYTFSTGSRVKRKYGIKEDFCGDFCTYCWCTLCYLTRDLRQVRNVPVAGQ